MSVPGVTRERLKATAKAVADNPYIPVAPNMRQLEFLAAPQKEKGYGGAAFGGKSYALLMEALMPVQQRGYAGLILRRSFPELALPDSIMDVAKQWLAGRPDVKWNERDKVFTFLKYDTRLQFGHLSREDDKFRYQGPSFQRILFDEATQFPWSQYSYLRSRLRRNTKVNVPPTLACATNPGGVGHNWFYNWFVKGDGKQRVFVSAKIDDNPHARAQEYKATLRDLDEITRLQLLEGRWVVDESGRPFKRAFWDATNRYLPGFDELTRPIARWLFVDTALKDRQQGAFNAVVVMELMSDYRVRLRYVWREKTSFGMLVRRISELMHGAPHGTPLSPGFPGFNRDGNLRGIIIEDKASGPALYQTIRDGQDPDARNLVRSFMPAGSKQERYGQAAVWCERGCVLLPQPNEDNAPWLFAFEEEVYEAPDGDYLDQADAFSMGVIFLEHLISTGYWTRERAMSEV